MASQFMLSNVVVNGTDVLGWTTHTIDPAVTQTLNAGASELDPSTAQVTAVAPIVTGATLDIKGILDLAFSTGDDDWMIPHIPITECDLHFTDVAAGATHGGAGLNPRARISKGVLIVTGLANNSEGLLEAQISIFADTDGTDSPIVFSDQDLPDFVTAPTLYVLRAIKNGTSGAVLSKLGGINIDFGVRTGRQTPANQIYPTDTVVNGFAPTMTFTTQDLAVALAASGLSGAIAGAGGLIVYLGKYDPSVPGVKATEALTLTFLGPVGQTATGSVWWADGLPLGGAAPQAVTYNVKGLGGTVIQADNAPLQYVNTGVTLPAESTDAGSFGPGPIKENAVAKELISGNVAFGLQWETPAISDVLPWPTTSYITRRNPVFAITTSEMDYVTGLTINGRVVNTSFFVYARKHNANGEPLTDGSVHIAVSCTEGLIRPTAIGGGHGTLLPSSFEVMPTGGLTLSTSSTI